MAIAKEELLERAEESVSTEVGGSALILHAEEGIYYQLDGVGTRIWDLLAEPISLESLVAQVVGEFEVEQSQCFRDTEALLGELLERRLVCRKKASG